MSKHKAIHHINGDPDDNRPDNIAVVAAPEPDKATARPWYVAPHIVGDLADIFYKADNPAGTPIRVARDMRPDRAALIVAAVNSFDALAGRVCAALHDAESRLYMLPVDADTTDKAVLESQIGQYQRVLAGCGDTALAGLPAPEPTVNEKLRTACQKAIAALSALTFPPIDTTSAANIGIASATVTCVIAGLGEALALADKGGAA